MNSQVSELQRRKQTAVRLSKDVREEVKLKLVNGGICYVFVSPEALDGKWKALLTKPSFSSVIKAVFCNEAHCIEIWSGGVDPFARAHKAGISTIVFPLSSALCGS